MKIVIVLLIGLFVFLYQVNAWIEVPVIDCNTTWELLTTGSGSNVVYLTGDENYWRDSNHNEIRDSNEGITNDALQGTSYGGASLKYFLSLPGASNYVKFSGIILSYWIDRDLDGILDEDSGEEAEYPLIKIGGGGESSGILVETNNDAANFVFFTPTGTLNNNEVFLSNQDYMEIHYRGVPGYGASTIKRWDSDSGWDFNSSNSFTIYTWDSSDIPVAIISGPSLVSMKQQDTNLFSGTYYFVLDIFLYYAWDIVVRDTCMSFRINRKPSSPTEFGVQ